MQRPRAAERIANGIIWLCGTIGNGGIPLKSWLHLFREARCLLRRDSQTEKDMYELGNLHPLARYGKLLDGVKEFLLIALVLGAWFFITILAIAVSSRH